MLSAAGAAGVTLAIRPGGLPLHVPSVFFASSAFVLTAVSSGAHRTRYGRFMLAGLCAFWCGDVLGAEYFYTGMAAFSLGHVAYISAFVTRGIAWKRILFALPLAAASTVIVLARVLPHLSQRADAVGVPSYCIVITTMLLAAAGASRGVRGKLIVAGGLLIYVSDIFLAHWRYVNFDPLNGYFCYPLYYLGCIIFALSTLPSLASTHEALVKG